MTDLETPYSLTIWATVQVLARVAVEDLEVEVVIDDLPAFSGCFGFVSALKLRDLRLPVAHIEGEPGVVDGGWLEPESHARHVLRIVGAGNGRVYAALARCFFP